MGTPLACFAIVYEVFFIESAKNYCLLYNNSKKDIKGDIAIFVFTIHNYSYPFSSYIYIYIFLYFSYLILSLAHSLSFSFSKLPTFLQWQNRQSLFYKINCSIFFGISRKRATGETYIWISIIFQKYFLIRYDRWPTLLIPCSSTLKNEYLYNQI